MRLLFRMWQDLYRGNRFACIIACTMCLSMVPPTVLARRYPYGVQGAQVVHGSVSFGHFGNTTTITASDRSVIDYISFNIARSDIVRFIQPSPGASVLNRITSARPTNIDGTLLANGRVFFVNPAGVYIGVDAQINVNQLVASGLNISNADFINDQMNFTGGDGTVTNQGDIIATEVILLGKHVINAGDISCPEGHIIMAAGERVFLRELGSGVMVEIDSSTGSEPQDSPTLVESEPGVLNQGNIEAAGGRITLGAGDFYAKAVSNVGSLSASVTTGKAGRIDMTANAGTISNTGSIEARSDSGTGGSIAAAADEVINSGTIDVTGNEGGSVVLDAIRRIGQFGTIHADGTGTQGGDVSLNAGETAALGSQSLTTANAGSDGDGGNVTVFSPDTALFWSEARIEAQGGTESGDGGFVEVSGSKHVEINGEVDASADHGAAGTFMIDPTDITVVDGIEYPAEPEQVDPDTGDIWQFNPTNHENEITDDFIEGLLSSGTSVTLDTASTYDAPGGGDIVIAAPIDNLAPYHELSPGDGVTLTLKAADDIEIRPGTGIDGSTLGTELNVVLQANHPAEDGGNDPAPTYGDVEVYAPVKTNGGDFTSTGVHFDNREGQIETTGGAINIDHSADVVVDSLNASEGAVTITSGGGIGEAIQDEAVDIIGGIVDLTARGGDIGPLEITASERLNVETSKDGSDIIISFPDQPPSPDDPTGVGSLILGRVHSAGAVDLEAVGGITVAGGDGIEISAKTSISLHAGASGKGDLSFQPTATLSAKEIVLRAGDGLNPDALDGYSENNEAGYTVWHGGDGTGARVDAENLGIDFENIEEDELLSLRIWQDAPITGTPDPSRFEKSKTRIDLTLQSDEGDVTATTADEWHSVSATALDGIRLEGSGDITTGPLRTRTKNVSIHSTEGDVIVDGRITADWNEEPLEDTEDAWDISDFFDDMPGGGVELLADAGAVDIRLAGDDDFLHPHIYGFTDDIETKTGVRLPGGEGRAAIVIISQESLHLADHVTLETLGTYGPGQEAGGSAVDDRNSIDFLSGSILFEQAGDPIDISIYLASRGGDVTVDCSVVMVGNRNDTMVVDARHTVQEFGSKFVSDLVLSGIPRLEVVSRTTQTLPEAIRRGTLPGAAEMYQGHTPSWISSAVEAEFIEGSPGSIPLPDGEYGVLSRYVLRAGQPAKVLATAEFHAVPPISLAGDLPEWDVPWFVFFQIMSNPTLAESIHEDEEEQKEHDSKQEEDLEGRLPIEIRDSEGNPVTPKVGAPLAPGYTIATGKHEIASVEFCNGSIVVLEPDSEITIQNPNLLLIRGRVFNWVREKIQKKRTDPKEIDDWYKSANKKLGVRTKSDPVRKVIVPAKSLIFIDSDGTARIRPSKIMGGREGIYTRTTKTMRLDGRRSQKAVAWLLYFGPI